MDTVTRLVLICFFLVCGADVQAYGLVSKTQGQLYRSPVDGKEYTTASAAHQVANEAALKTAYSSLTKPTTCDPKPHIGPYVFHCYSEVTTYFPGSSTVQNRVAPSATYTGRDAGQMCPNSSTETPMKNCECNLGSQPAPGSKVCQKYNCPGVGGYTAVTQADVSLGAVGPFCMQGCTVTASSIKVGVNGGLYGTWPFKSTGMHEYCGGKDSPQTDVDSGEDKLPDPPVKCGAGQCPGNINGADVCVACKSTKLPGSTTAASGAGTGKEEGIPDGGQKEEATECGESSCVTTTTIRDSNGTVVGTKKEEKPKENFCSENPGLSICKDGKWGGACGAYSCDGDAIQCALSLQVHQSACKWAEVDEAQIAAAKAAMTGEAQPAGHPGANAVDKSLAFSSVIDRSDLLGGGCPIDDHISVAGRSFIIPWSRACASLQMVGNLAVAFSMLAAAFIVFRS